MSKSWEERLAQRKAERATAAETPAPEPEATPATKPVPAVQRTMSPAEQFAWTMRHHGRQGRQQHHRELLQLADAMSQAIRVGTVEEWAAAHRVECLDALARAGVLIDGIVYEGAALASAAWNVFGDSARPGDPEKAAEAFERARGAGRLGHLPKGGIP